MKSQLHRDGKNDIHEIDIIFVEKDSAIFERQKIDLKQYSPFVNKIFRCASHSEVFEITNWMQCQLIIAHNPDNAGFEFFHNLYLDDAVRDSKIHGLIYTRGYQEMTHFHRQMRYLYEQSDHLFLGVVYKRYGSLEKLMEVVQNIALNINSYPMIDWVHQDVTISTIEPEKLENYKIFHNIRNSIYTCIHPFITVLNQYLAYKEVKIIHDFFHHNPEYKSNLKENFEQVKDNLKLLLSYELQDNKTYEPDFKNFEMHLISFINEVLIKECPSSESNKLRKKSELNRIVGCITNTNNITVLENLLQSYQIFIRSMNKVFELYDKFHFFSHR